MIDDEACVYARREDDCFFYIDSQMMTNSLISKLMTNRRTGDGVKTQPYSINYMD